MTREGKIIVGVNIAVVIVWGISMGARVMGEMRGREILGRNVGESVEITGTVAKDPDTNESRTNIVLKDLRAKEREIPGKLFVTLRINREVRRSDTVTLSGKLAEGFGTYGAAMYRPSILKTVRPEPGDVLLDVRNWYAERVEAAVGGTEAKLGLGYLLGMKSGLPTELLELLRTVGMTHIIVTSGTHMSIIVGLARRIFGKVSRFFGASASLLLIILYIGMVGLAPSITRAGLVSALSLIVWYTGRKFGALRLLIIVAMITLLIDPMYVQDLGWLLSFAAFGGVMIVGPRLTRFLYGKQKPGLVASTLITTLAAFLTCTPILLYYYGTMSLISFVANLLILPTVGVAMGLTFLSGMLPAMGVLAGWILKYHIFVVEFLGAQKSFLIELPAGNPLVFLAYAPLILIILIAWRRERRLFAVENDVKVSKSNASSQNWAFEMI